ncbi:hypothetical protein [Fontibacillus sp. BL9]|uniref:hypothetical protein n=1 Tax=Fontibacillus sp. BL9 TaxID=3389971 RepID=UPI00397B4BE0
MSLQHGSYQQNVLYQADKHLVQNLKDARNHVHHICSLHKNKVVKIETLDGQTFVGRIINCNKGLLYLAVRNPHHGTQRAFFGNPYYNDDELILTLVLYELLVITLLST